MNTWTQVYDPFGNIWISAAVALIPIIFFLSFSGFPHEGVCGRIYYSCINDFGGVICV